MVYTQGPWKIEKPDDELVAFERHALSFGIIKASAKNVLGMKPSVIVWADSEAGDGFFQEIALVSSDDIDNARLIAAAPELLDELRQCAVELEEAKKILGGSGWPGISEIYGQAEARVRAAIAKATTETA